VEYYYFLGVAFSSYVVVERDRRHDPKTRLPIELVVKYYFLVLVSYSDVLVKSSDVLVKRNGCHDPKTRAGHCVMKTFGGVLLCVSFVRWLESLQERWVAIEKHRHRQNYQP
jgi:hypothetical protein